MNYQKNLDAALSYLNDDALSPLALCPPDCRRPNCGASGKIPHTQGWQGYCAEHPTEESLIEDFNRLKGNVGIACGLASGVIVVDEDTMDAYRYLENRLDSENLAPPLSQSGRENGGFHHWFAFRADVDSQDVVLGGHQFEIKSTGAQVVAPPSMHQSGNPYQWIRRFNRDDLIDLPDWFIEESAKHHQKKSAQIGAKSQAQRNESDHPNEIYNDSDAYEQLLSEAGWRQVGVVGDNELWRRPGKDAGHSACFHVGYRTFYVFTGNAEPFGKDRCYWPFTILALLKFDGDLAAAAKHINPDPPPRPPQPAPGSLQKRDEPPQDAAPPSTSSKNYRWTELGNAERFADQHQDDVRFVEDWGQWYVWDGRRWAPDALRAVNRKAKATVREMYAEASQLVDDEHRNKFIRFIMASESGRKLASMMDLAKAEGHISAMSDQFNRHPMLMNLKNGTLNLESGQKHDHRRRDLITKIAPVEYNPDAECPTWLAFLDKIMASDPQVIGFLQRAVGYSLTAKTDEHCLFFMHGSGRNGKTTFIETIKALMGDYAQKAPTSMLMMQRFDQGIPNDIARLPGARLAVVAEVEEGKRLSEGIVKDLTGGDTLTARFLRQEYFDFTPTHKLWMYGNHKPVIRGTDDGIWSRIPLIPFDVFIPDAERDKQIGAKLRAELSGILNWALRGCMEWQEGGLRMPDAVIEATKAYRDEMDEIGDFIETHCILNENVNSTSSDLWEAYQEWAHNAGEKHTLGRRAFANRLTARGCESSTVKVAGKNVRVWLKIGLAGTQREDEGTQQNDRDTVLI